MQRYANQWHKPDQPEYGPETYVSDGPVEVYRDFEIHDRVAGQWDVVKDGVCVGQFAGIGGAKRDIDRHLDGTGHSYMTIPDEKPAPVPSPSPGF